MKKRLPNIILIVMDTVGAKHMSLYGYERRTTPNLERLAEECTVYSRCFSPSCWTLPAHASIFTGLYPSDHGVSEINPYLGTHVSHLANLLKMSGYDTYGFSSNYSIAPVTGIGRHFDLFRDYGKSEDEWLIGEGGDEYPQRQEFLRQLFFQKMSLDKALFFSRYILKAKDWPLLHAYLRRYWGKIRQAPDPLADSAPYTLKSLAEGLEIIKKHTQDSNGRPFFMFFNLMEAHHYYNPPVAARKYSQPQHKQNFETSLFYSAQKRKAAGHLIPQWLDLYDDEILYLDSVLGDFYHKLKAENALENTTVIITSDHGEHFGEKGHFEHRLALYNPLIWVPLVVKFPDGTASVGTITDRLTSLNDLFSTILDLAENPMPRPFTSTSLLSSELPETAASLIIDPSRWQLRMTADFGGDEEWVQEVTFHRFALLLAKGWKLLVNPQGQIEAFDLRADFWEENNIFPTLPEEMKDAFLGLLKLHSDNIFSKTPF